MHQIAAPPDFEERRIYGFVEAIEPPIPENRYSRFALMLDCIDAAAFDESPTASRQAKYLSIIRTISTPQRILDFFDVRVPEEGKWIQITLGTRPNFPPAWALNAGNDFGGPIIRTNIIGLETLSHSSDDTSSRKTLAKLEKACVVNSQDSGASTIQDVTPRTGRLHIRMIDVGHASCAAIHAGTHRRSPIIGYFDAGAPAFFHSKSFPRSFNEGPRVPTAGFVVLSHWDFDHYSLAVTRLKSLQNLDWYAPRQEVGPNAANFQRALGARLHFLGRRTIQIAKGLSLHRGTAPAQDRNNSGYVMCLKQKGEKVLLTADVGYDHVSPALKNKLTAISVPHHGGRGSAPPPNGRGVAAVSYGVPNRYRHPIENNLSAHARIGWTVSRTAAHGHSSRGDRWLTAP